MRFINFRSFLLVLLTIFFLNCSSKGQTKNSSVFIRLKVKQPVSQNLQVTVSGYRHLGEDWYFPRINNKVSANEWSEWIDLSSWNWHGKAFRSGGIAEYPALSLAVKDLVKKQKIENCEFEVQLSDQPSDRNIPISFTEKSDSNTIIFLAPFPVRENSKDFETASQIIERQANWAKEATKGKPIKLKKFDIITTIWGMKSPALKAKSVDLLHSLGFNVIPVNDLFLTEKYDLKTYRKNWLYLPDPETVKERWLKNRTGIERSLKTEKGKTFFEKTSFWEIADEVSTLNFKRVDKKRLNGWFYDYLKIRNFDIKESEKIEQIEYPLEEIYRDQLDRSAPLQKRKFLYNAAKFGHWWSAKQLRQINDLVQEFQPESRTSTLLPSHGFFGNAWGPTKIGMTSGMLDIFEIAEQNSLRQLAVEDWMGLNHMYGPEFTWTGGQTFGFFNALARSATKDTPMKIQGFITPSDDKYLRLKAYSSLGQGAKSFYFWSYGPTYVSTENYWSDLQSQYEGIAKLNRSLEKSEDVLYPAKTVSDDVAILYSVSHDIWNNLYQSAFVEKRLLWHSLRHLQIQPDFLREEGIEEGKLDKYKILYITDWNITRKASLAIDKWVKNGGILYLSAGAATRDEFNEPFSPPFAKEIWGNDPTENFINEQSTFNERTVLPTIKPLTTARLSLQNTDFNLPVIGARLDLNSKLNSFAKFADGKNAGAVVPYGKGQIIAVGFMPMLAYGKMADFKLKTLEEKWQPEARRIIEKTLEIAKVDPVIKTNVPVVETSLLKGSEGSAIVLANYTYQPINTLKIEVKIDKPVKEAISVEGKPVKIISQKNGVLTLELPLEWTDILLLK
jgi:hypothetical protein